MAGFSAGSRERSRTVPRLVGRKLATLAVNAGNACRRLAEALKRKRLNVVLQIGAILVGIGAGEQPELRRRHGQRAAPEQRIFGDHARAAERRVIALVERGDAVDLVDQAELQVILQVGADAGPVGDDGDAVLAQVLRRADARQQHDLRRTDRSRQRG